VNNFSGYYDILKYAFKQSVQIIIQNSDFSEDYEVHRVGDRTSINSMMASYKYKTMQRVEIC
jgi:hypothetical protein